MSLPARGRGPLGRFTLRQRLKIACVATAGYWAIGLICRTIRWETAGLEYLEAIYRSGNRVIFTSWHGRIFPSIWYWRHRSIAVMTSMNLDGEMIARCIERYGYGAVRGSSSRGGLRALAEMAGEIGNGRDAGFTIDGPRGPRYVAKQGPVLLARKSGAAIFCFHISMKRRIQLNSWDHFQIPMPFTRAKVFMADPLWIPPDTDENTVRGYRDRMQGILDELQERGNDWEKSG